MEEEGLVLWLAPQIGSRTDNGTTAIPLRAAPFRRL